MMPQTRQQRASQKALASNRCSGKCQSSGFRPETIAKDRRTRLYPVGCQTSHLPPGLHHKSGAQSQPKYHEVQPSMVPTPTQVARTQSGFATLATTTTWACNVFPCASQYVCSRGGAPSPVDPYMQTANTQISQHEPTMRCSSHHSPPAFAGNCWQLVTWPMTAMPRNYPKFLQCSN